MKLKVITVVGTRPEIIRLSRLIPKLDEHTDHLLVHTGQNFDPKLKDVFFEDMEIRHPDIELDVDTSTFGSVMGGTITSCETVFRNESPDAVVVLGDTNSSMAAIVAERMHIPVYHLEAGNRSFDSNVPEELNRRVVDHAATFNLPYTRHAYNNLIAEGIRPRFISESGSPMREVLSFYEPKISSSRATSIAGVTPGEYLLFSFHRQENVDDPKRLSRIIRAVEEAVERFEIPALVSTHPRTKLRLSNLGVQSTAKIKFLEPFNFTDFIRLQKDAFCVISDSGSLSEEASIAGFKAVSLRDSTERPEALEMGVLTLSGIEGLKVIEAVNHVRKLSVVGVPEGYLVENFSDRVVGFILSTASQYFDWKGIRPIPKL